MVASRVLITGVLGVAMMRLSDRLAPDENADDLARDVLDVTIAGLKSGVALRTAAGPCLIDDETEISSAGAVAPRTPHNRGAVRCHAHSSLLSQHHWAWPRSQPRQVAARPPARPPKRQKLRSRCRGVTGRRQRAADRPLHPRDRQPDGRGTGRRRRGNRRAASIATPVERGTPVADGHRADAAVADRNRSAGPRSRGQRRADRGAARPDAGDARSTSTPFPKCRTRKRRYELAQSEFDRIQSLLDQRVVSQSEFDQRRTQMEAARQQYEAAQERRRPAVPGAAGGARARRARAARRWPTPSSARRSTGIVAERLVSVGDYVTKGMKVAVVVRVNPLRVAADGARAVRLGGRRRPAGRVRGRRLSGPAVRRARSATSRRRSSRTSARSPSKRSCRTPAAS